MSSREERMARNEGASTEINERIEGAHEGEPPTNRIDIVCECARKTCDAALDITLDEYEHVRKDARQFVILPKHFVGDIERIVFENDRFAVIAKREGFLQTLRGTRTREGKEDTRSGGRPRSLSLIE
jgi:hypothetical protein